MEPSACVPAPGWDHGGGPTGTIGAYANPADPSTCTGRGIKTQQNTNTVPTGEDGKGDHPQGISSAEKGRQREGPRQETDSDTITAVPTDGVTQGDHMQGITSAEKGRQREGPRQATGSHIPVFC